MGLDRGLELIRAGEFFAAHEELEDEWRAASAGERDFLQGLVHVAVAWYQAGRGNRVGCERQLAKATRRLGPYAPAHRGVYVTGVLASVAAASAVVQAGSLELPPPLNIMRRMAAEPLQTSLSPQLSVRRGREALAFYTAAFGAVEIHRVGGTQANEEVVAQLTVGNASFWVSDESPPNGNFSPETLGGGTVRLLLVVPDPHSVVERAVSLGATEVVPVEEEHGWLLGRIEDPFGHHWEIGKPLGQWPPSSATREGA